MNIITRILAVVLLAVSPQLMAQEPVSNNVAKSAPAKTSTAAADKVNVNTATAVQLAEALSGIGEKKAQAIVDHRNIHGKFTTINDLSQVKGIGASLIASNYHLIEL